MKRAERNVIGLDREGFVPAGDRGAFMNVVAKVMGDTNSITIQDHLPSKVRKLLSGANLPNGALMIEEPIAPNGWPKANPFDK